MSARDGGAAPSAVDLQNELDDLAAALGHSVSLDSPDGALLGYSTQAADVDPVRVAAILTRRVPDVVLGYQRRHGIATATEPVHLPANPDLGMSARTCLPIRRERRVIAYLWILDEDRTLGADALAMVGSVGARIADLLPAADPSAVDTFLASLLIGQVEQELVAELARQDRRVRDKSLRFVCVVPTTVTAGERSPAVATDLSDLARVPSSLGSARAHGQILILASCAAAPPNDGPDGLTTPAANRTQVIGRSNAFRVDDTPAASIATFAARTVAAAGCAALDATLPEVITWDDLGIYRRLLLAGRPDDLDEAPLFPDDASSSMLRHTLETYLDHGGDAARTIAALGIHRTTFYYRLERVSTVSGVRLDDGLARTDAHVALKARRLSRARDQFAWTDALIANLAGTVVGER
jgi:hypothetical protein